MSALTTVEDVAVAIAESIGMDDDAEVTVHTDNGDGTFLVENANGSKIFKVTVTEHPHG
jgi:hypothetical protein